MLCWNTDIAGHCWLVAGNGDLIVARCRLRIDGLCQLPVFYHCGRHCSTTTEHRWGLLVKLQWLDLFTVWIHCVWHVVSCLLNSVSFNDGHLSVAWITNCQLLPISCCSVRVIRWSWYAAVDTGRMPGEVWELVVEFWSNKSCLCSVSEQRVFWAADTWPSAHCRCRPRCRCRLWLWQSCADISLSTDSTFVRNINYTYKITIIAIINNTVSVLVRTWWNSEQASWFITIKTIYNDNNQISNTRFYEMLNGEADRRESCSLLEVGHPNIQ